MNDGLMIGIMIVLFALAFALVHGCNAIIEKRAGDEKAAKNDR